MRALAASLALLLSAASPAVAQPQVEPPPPPPPPPMVPVPPDEPPPVPPPAYPGNPPPGAYPGYTPAPVFLPPPVVVVQPPANAGRGFLFQLSLGAGFRSLFAVPAGGVWLGIGLGGQTQGAAIYAQIDALVGATEGGLTTGQVKVGFAVDGVFGRVRFGGGISGGWYILRRVTRPDDPMYDFSLGPFLQLSVDAVRWGFGHQAFFVGLRTAADFLIFSLANGERLGFPAVYELTLSVGIRI